MWRITRTGGMTSLWVALLLLRGSCSFFAPPTTRAGCRGPPTTSTCSRQSTGSVLASTMESHHDTRQQRNDDNMAASWITQEWQQQHRRELSPRDTGSLHPTRAIDNNESTGSSSLIKFVPPLHDAIAVKLLRCMDWELQRGGVRLHLDRLILQNNNSVRRIQAGRYEIFVQADKKETTAFDWIAAKVGQRVCEDTDGAGRLLGVQALSADQVKDIILHYARQQAHASNTRYVTEEYQYQNFAILINFDEVPAQYPHIDLQEPNAQFALVITPDSPGTIWYEPSYQIQTARDFQQALRATKQQQSSVDDNDNGDDYWVEALDSNPWVRDRLQKYGNVLSPDLREHRPNCGAPLPTGALLSLPGGVVHAGPECSKFRAIMFFTGYPTLLPQPTRTDDSVMRMKIAPYNPDVQYFASVFLADILTRTWSQLAIPHRRYLLKHLVAYVLQAPANNRNMHKHLPRYYGMKEFAQRIEETDIAHSESALDEYVEQWASRQEVLF